MKNEKGEAVGFRTPEQQRNDEQFKANALKLIDEAGENWSIHCLAVMKRNTIARLLYLHDLYKMILDVPGVICEFGVQWGATMGTLVNLRALLEPHNTARTIYGFDTFDGFSGSSEKDGTRVADGDYKTRSGHEQSLHDILKYHESICPYPDREKFQLIKGDAATTVGNWMEENPHAVISLAIFDMDIYEPTRVVLEKIRSRLVKGSVLVFDEFSCAAFPGETLAVEEVLGLSNIRPIKHPLQNFVAMVQVQ